jgi:hypothetical protein
VTLCAAAGAVFFAAGFFRAAFFTGALFFAAFLTAAFFAGFFAAAFSCCALAALTASHRFFVAAMIAFLPAAESFRFGLGAASGAAVQAPF